MSWPRYPSLQAGGVCVIGNLNVDLIISDVPHLPRWGTEVVGSDHRFLSSGQAGYLAFALARMGIETSVIGTVGQDHYGQQIRDDLRCAGVDTSGVHVSVEQATGLSVAIVRHDGERAFVSDFASSRDLNEALVASNWQCTRASSIVCLVGLFNLPGLSLDGAYRLLARARREGKVTMLDTGWDPEEWPDATVAAVRDLLSEVTVFLPNADEALALTGIDDAERAATGLATLGPDFVVVKCGDQGSCVRLGSMALHLPAFQVDVCDAVGAGDVFNAGLILGLHRGWTVDRCLTLGNAAAATYISRYTDRFPTAEEVDAVLDAYCSQSVTVRGIMHGDT